MELSVGGFGWIPNLLVPDESLILPVSVGLINLAIVEVGFFFIFLQHFQLQHSPDDVISF
jgi:hypothetical protein